MTLLFRAALRLGELDGHLDAAEVRARREELERLPELLDAVWTTSHDRLRDMARRLSVIRNWFFIGRGIYHGLAMEAALILEKLFH